jgi:hypothetical protein
MARDGPYDDGTSDGRPEQGLSRGEPGSDGAAARTEPAESRSRAEYYETLRAAVNGSVQTDAADTRTERSGWDAMAAENRPDLDALRVTPERLTHILDGDPARGGGHRSGTGKPGKTEFPASWDDEKMVGHVLDVARRPDSPPVHQHWNDRWVCTGTRDRVEVSVVVLRSGEVWTAWPEEGGPGVVRNPRKETS